MTRDLQEQLFRFAPARWTVAAALVGRGYWSLRQGRLYRGLVDLCRVERVFQIPVLQRLARRAIVNAIDQAKHSPENQIVASYLADPASTTCASLFSLSGRGTVDLFRDVIVLKQAREKEKGVVLLKYVRTFEAVAALFDLKRLMARYTFVLEPCWAGYSDPNLLLFLTPDQPVFVQCFTQSDYDWTVSVGAPFVPLRLGPADWVDADLFKPIESPKIYDVVMVANWAGHKRHAVLFDALRTVRHRTVRVLLIGFPLGGRTADDIKREARAIGNPNVTVDVIENLPPDEVARHVSQAKAFVFLSRKEGDNKALVEAMFADVPAVVYAQTIGGASSRINSHTGVLAADRELCDRIFEVIDQGERFAPRKWALTHTGSAVATRTLDQAIAAAARERGDHYTTSIVEKTNAPNLAYKDPRSRARFQADYDFILSCRRDRATSISSAVA